LGLFTMKRVPEMEVMDDESEVEAYSSAAAQSYLEAIDKSLVEHVARLYGQGEPSGRALDLGCGPGQITILLATRWPAVRWVGLDAAPAMLAQGRKDAAAAGVETIDFQAVRVGPEGDGRLPYEDASFDLVVCNSVLHHLADPLQSLDEMARVAKPGAAFLLRDLARPSAPLYPLHVRVFGRHYEGEMRRLYEASVRAAYTVEELEDMLRRSRWAGSGARVFHRGRTHLGIERATNYELSRKSA
jgi:ubiquinone/menaquinone biosynthesis C-methylase UbiE